MSLKTLALRNIGTGWLALGVMSLVTFFLYPFVLHRLGDTAFGLWVLANSVAGYFGFFDLGIQSSLVRYVARFSALRDEEQLARLINTSVFYYSLIAIVLLVFTLAGYQYVTVIFRIPAAYAREAQLLLLLVGFAVAIGFPLGVFSGVMAGLQRFYWEGATQVVTSLLRALAIVLVLTHGGGVLSVAAITVAVNPLSNVVYWILIRRQIPLRFKWKYVDRGTFKLMITYGSTAFFLGIGAALRFHMDAFVIGAFLSASAITIFSIPARLLDYPVRLIHKTVQIFTPMSAQFDAKGNVEGLRKVFLAGNRACALVMFPICAMLLILGRSLIEVWVGPEYLSSYPVLVTLVIPTTLYFSQSSSNRILFGMNRHPPLALVAIIEGVSNLLLSIVFVRIWGVLGDALGTAIPMMGTSLLFMPFYLCHLLKVRVTTFLKEAYLAPFALCLPMVAVLLGMQHLFRAHSYLQLLLQVAAGGVAYAIFLFWFLFNKEATGVKLRADFVEFLQRAFTR